MKKKIILLVAFGFVLTLASCDNQVASSSVYDSSQSIGSDALESSNSSVNESSLSTEPVDYKVVLPNVDGITLSLKSDDVKAGDTVELYAKVANGKRLDEVSMNGTSLTKLHSSEKDVFVFRFVMPKDSNAVISVQVVDVYRVVVSQSVSHVLTLAGIGDSYFAAGEEVTFTPATYAGYYYTSISVINADVTLNKKEDSEVYSFTMPASIVTITATFDKNAYMVNYEENEAYTLSIKNGSYYKYGEKVSFTCKVNKPDLQVDTISVDGEEITSSNGTYEFDMPFHPVTLSVKAKTQYKSITSENSAYFKVTSLQTLVESEMVDVTDSNVLSNQLVKVVVGNLNDDDHGFVVDTIKVYGGVSNNQVDVDTEVQITKSDGVTFTFNAPSEYPFLKITIVEKEEAGFPVGSYHSFIAKQPSSNNTITIDESGNISTGSSSYSPKGIMQAQGGKKYTYDLKNSYSSISYVAFLDKDSKLLVQKDLTTTNSDVSITNYVLDGKELNTSTSYSILSTSDAYSLTTCYQQFYSLSFNDGSTISYVWDFASSSIYWDVKLNVISGQSEKSPDAVVEVLSSENVSLMKVKINSRIQSQQYYGIKVES